MRLQVDCALCVSACKLCKMGKLANAHAHKLACVRVYRCSQRSAASIQTWAECRLPKLQHLDLSTCRQVCDADLQALRCVSTLRTLSLHGCEDISDRGLTALAGLPLLASLNLHNCCKVSCEVDCTAAGTGQCWSALPLRECVLTQPPGEGQLSPGWCSSALCAAASLQLTQLRQLPACSDSKVELLRSHAAVLQVSDRGLASLTTGMTSLDIAGCVAVTERGVASLAANMPDLAVLRVSEGTS